MGIADLVVIGAGPVGLTTALALGQAGFSVICAGPRLFSDNTKPDTRTTALFTGSIHLLKNLGLWTAIQPSACALRKIRILDDTRYLFRAPETLFNAADLGLDAFGYNVENVILVNALHEAISHQKNVQYIETQSVTDIIHFDDHLEIHIQEGQKFSCRLLIGADGKNSPSRKAAQIETLSWSYPQTALTCNFEHSKSHDSISNEFHREAGPFTTVPLGQNCSSLVWVEQPGQAKKLLSLSDADFASEIQIRLHGLLGRIKTVGPRSSFPLSGLTAKIFAKNRTALVGEAAHVIPPIGAQGLNLGLRDAAMLCECLTEGRPFFSMHDTSAINHILGHYNSKRRMDVWSRVFTIDLLNRSLLSGLLPAQAARKLGLSLLGRIGPLRYFIMKQGIQPDYAMPELMRIEQRPR